MKATKFDEILLRNVKLAVKISSILVAFLENSNFIITLQIVWTKRISHFKDLQANKQVHMLQSRIWEPKGLLNLECWHWKTS